MATEVEEIQESPAPRQQPARVLIVVEVPDPRDDTRMIMKEFEATGATNANPYRVAKGLAFELNNDVQSWLNDLRNTPSGS